QLFGRLGRVAALADGGLGGVQLDDLVLQPLAELVGHRLEGFFRLGDGRGVDAAKTPADLLAKGVGWLDDLGGGRLVHVGSPDARPQHARSDLRTGDRAQAENCSASTRSSNERSASNSMVRAMSRRSCTSTRTTSRTSKLSATALTGRLSGSSTSKQTWAACGSRAPRQRRGRKALIGVRASTLASSGMIGPWADRL